MKDDRVYLHPIDMRLNPFREPLVNVDLRANPLNGPFPRLQEPLRRLLACLFRAAQGLQEAREALPNR